MEDQVDVFLNSILIKFPNAKFEVIYNSLSSNLCHFVLRDHESKGFGSSTSLLTAAHKAYSEFIERKAMRELNKMFMCFETSNGLAAHFEKEAAKLNSRYEVIERDAFLLAWHGGHSPYWIDNSYLSKLLSIDNLDILKVHERHGLTVQIGIIAVSKNVYSAIACVRMTKSRFYIDTKTGHDLGNLLNALVESVSFNSHFILKGYVGVGVRVPRRPMDHFDYYVRPKRGLDWFFRGSSQVLELPLGEIITMDVYPDIILQKATDRFVFYSEAPDMQSYYCGNFCASNINEERFRKVFGHNLKFNKRVHPLS